MDEYALRDTRQSTSSEDGLEWLRIDGSGLTSQSVASQRLVAGYTM